MSMPKGFEVVFGLIRKKWENATKMTLAEMGGQFPIYRGRKNQNRGYKSKKDEFRFSGRKGTITQFAEGK